jgi:hypothetical protein
MKAAIAVLALLIACLLAGDCQAEGDGRFMNIGEDYGRNVIGTLTANETEQAAGNNETNGTLWNWGTLPKGGMMVNGTLVQDPFSNPAAMENPASTFKQVGVDAFTGQAIYSYQPPGGAAIKYFYVDTYTKLPVYVEWGDINTGASISPESESQGYSLPSAFR